MGEHESGVRECPRDLLIDEADQDDLIEGVPLAS
jgi:hypothetical protein